MIRPTARPYLESLRKVHAREGKKLIDGSHPASMSKNMEGLSNNVGDRLATYPSQQRGSLPRADLAAIVGPRGSPVKRLSPSLDYLLGP